MEALGTDPQINISLCNYSLRTKRAGKKISWWIRFLLIVFKKIDIHKSSSTNIF